VGAFTLALAFAPATLAARNQKTYILSAAARYHGVLVAIEAGDIFGPAGDLGNGVKGANLSIDILAKRGRYTTETDTAIFALKGHWLTIGPRGAEINTGKQLGGYGHIQLRFSAAALHGKELCAKELKRSARRAVVRGVVALKLGNGRVGVIHLNRMTGNGFPFTTKPPACLVGNHPTPPPTQPTNKQNLMLTATTQLGMTSLAVLPENGKISMSLGVVAERKGASIDDAMFFRGLPPSTLTVEGGRGKLTLGSELAPVATGSLGLTFGPETLGAPCLEQASASGQLHFNFEVAGEVVFPGGSGVYCR